jgi:hypothetical protein
MPSPGSYLLGAAQLAAVVLSLGFTAFRLRQALLPSWQGSAARLVEAITAIAVLICLAELLGVLGLLYAGALVAVTALIAVLAWFLPAGGAERGDHPSAPQGGGGPRSVTGPAGPEPPEQSLWALAVMTAVVAIVAFHWAVTTKHALDRGVFNFDSLWYHLPFAAGFAQSHSTTALVHPETVFTNWFYPQNSELLHGVGILLTGRDTLSLFLNFGWLAVAFLAAWTIGRPYGRGPLTVVAAAVLLECHTLVVRDPGSAKNDLAAAALILAAIAILVEAWHHHRAVPAGPRESKRNHDPEEDQVAVPRGRPGSERNHGLEPGWGVAAAGLAAGLAAGTRVTVLAMAAALSLAVVVLAPRGRRWAAAAWWFLPALAGGGYWYARNLVVAGNPIPEIHSLGPISLPHPERLQEGRPDFAIAHYATDTGVWREYFAPGLHQAFGVLWPLILAGAALAALWALLRGRDRIVRWSGGVALFGLLAYLFTPLSAAGAEGEPVGFGINIRYVIPALLAGTVLLPLPRWFDDRRRWWGLMAVLVLVFAVTDRPDDALHDSARVFALAFDALAVLVPAALWLWRERGAAGAAFLAALAALAIALVAIGYPLQRHYLEGRFANDGPRDTQIPGMNLDAAYRWARGIEGARIGLAGSTAGFAGYGFYGPDLSNRVVYLGEKGPHGAFNAIPTCRGFREAVNAADLDYLVTSPFLNFLHPSDPIASPEARWLRGEEAVRPLLHEGPVTVWKVSGELDPAACGPANAPLREVPNTPGAGA